MMASAMRIGGVGRRLLCVVTCSSWRCEAGRSGRRGMRLQDGSLRKHPNHDCSKVPTSPEQLPTRSRWGSSPLTVQGSITPQPSLRFRGSPQSVGRLPRFPVGPAAVKWGQAVQARPLNPGKYRGHWEHKDGTMTLTWALPRSSLTIYPQAPRGSALHVTMGRGSGGIMCTFCRGPSSRSVVHLVCFLCVCSLYTCIIEFVHLLGLSHCELLSCRHRL